MTSGIFVSRNDVLLTCCLQSSHGVSGHTMEMLEYLYYLRRVERVDAAVLFPFEFSQDRVRTILRQYVLSQEELDDLFLNIHFLKNIKLLKAKTVIFVDGIIQYRPGVKVIADNIILFRCARECSAEMADAVLQDTRLYPDLPNSAHYVKKVLVDKLRPCARPDEKIGMIYATRSCRELPTRMVDDFLKMDFSKILVLSDQPYDLPAPFVNLSVPVDRLFDKFTHFLYTPVGGYCEPFDCSPRLPVECKVHGKEFVLCAPLYRGLDVRLYDMECNFEGLKLKKSDALLKYL